MTDAVSGGGIFVGFINNSTNNNTAVNNGLLVRAGHSVYNAAFESNLIAFQRPSGTVLGSISQAGATSVAYNTTSDERLKQNIHVTESGIDQLMQVGVYDYQYKDDPTYEQTGFLAQQLNTIFPDAVHVGGDDESTDPWMVDYGRITPLLVKAIQDQQREIEQLKLLVNQLLAANTETK